MFLLFTLQAFPAQNWQTHGCASQTVHKYRPIYTLSRSFPSGPTRIPPILAVHDIEDLDSIHRIKVWADHHFWIEEPIHSYDALTNAIISTILDKEVNIRSSFQSHCMAFR